MVGTFEGQVHASGKSAKTNSVWVSLLQKGQRDLVSIYGLKGEPPAEGQIIKLQGEVKSYDGRLSVKAL